MLKPIFLPDPVNRSHPLNRRRDFWWLTIPEIAGGSQAYSLVGNNHGATTFDASSGWRTTARRGGRGQINLNASPTTVDFGTPPTLNGANQATLACWIYRPSTSVTAGFGGSFGPTNGSNRFSSIWFSDGNLYSNFESTNLAYGYCALSGIGWHRIVLVFDGTSSTNATRASVYIDGIKQSLSFVGTIPTSLGNVGPLTIGKDSSDRYTKGSYDDFSFWSRALSATEVFEDYIVSSTGYTDILNRIDSRSAGSSSNVYSINSGITLAFANSVICKKNLRLSSSASFGTSCAGAGTRRRGASTNIIASTNVINSIYKIVTANQLMSLNFYTDVSLNDEITKLIIRIYEQILYCNDVYSTDLYVVDQYDRSLYFYKE